MRSRSWQASSSQPRTRRRCGRSVTFIQCLLLERYSLYPPSQAILTLEQSTLERELAKQQDRVLKRWKKLIQGLRIRQRLLDQFKDPEEVTDEVLAKELSGKKEKKAKGKGKVRFLALRRPVTLDSPLLPQAKAEAQSPAPETPDADAASAPSLKIRLNGSGTSAVSSPATANGSNKRHSRSSPSPTSLSPSDESAPPPRKRVASSTTTTSAEAGTLSGTSSSGRTLRVRLPKKEEAEEDASDEGGRRRSTRASAQTAKGKLAIKENDEDEELADANGGIEAPAAEASDEGFEFDEDF